MSRKRKNEHHLWLLGLLCSCYGQEDVWDATSPAWWCIVLRFTKVNHGNWRKVVNSSLFLFSSVSSKIWQMWEEKHCRMVASNVFPWEMHFYVSWISLTLSFLPSDSKPAFWHLLWSEHLPGLFRNRVTLIVSTEEYHTSECISCQIMVVCYCSL